MVKPTFPDEKVNRIKKLLKHSYDHKSKVKGLVKDKQLSSKRVSVFSNPENAKAYVVHRGTANLKDWATDFTAALGYEGGNRFRHSEKIQARAEKKYGANKITTVGHSLGGRLAEKVGQNSNKVITYNKFATPRSIISSHFGKGAKNQTDIRSSGDLASLPSSLLEKRSKNHNLIQFKTKNISNPIQEHTLISLNTENFKRK